VGIGVRLRALRETFKGNKKKEVIGCEMIRVLVRNVTGLLSARTVGRLAGMVRRDAEEPYVSQERL